MLSFVGTLFFMGAVYFIDGFNLEPLEWVGESEALLFSNFFITFVIMLDSSFA